MKILINTASTYKGGGVQVAKSFIEECKNFDSNEYDVILGEKITNYIDIDKFPPNFNFHKISYRPATRVFSIKKRTTFFDNLENEVKPDIVFTTSGPAYWRPKSPHLMGFNLPHYLYKESPFFKQLSLSKRLYWAMKGLVIKYFTKKDADYYVVQTEDANLRLRNWIKSNKVETVTNTYGNAFNLNTSNTNLILPIRKNEKRFLMLSAFYNHKNFNIINEIIKIIEDKDIKNIKFILTIDENIYKSYFSKISKKYIQNIGPVRPEDCPKLYGECDYVFLPTLLECFSANYVEAMKMEKVILTSNLSFAHTVCKDAAVYFNPTDPQDIVNKIQKTINSKELQEKKIKLGKKRLSYFSTPLNRAKNFIEILSRIKEKASG